MYERFTDRSRKVMKLANDEAQDAGSDFIATEHLLLGLVREGAGVAAHVLANFDVGLDSIRREIEKLKASISQIESSSASHPTSKFIENSLEEAGKLNHHYVGTEHMLLALLREPNSTASRALTNLGLSLDEIRSDILNLLGHGIDGG